MGETPLEQAIQLLEEERDRISEALASLRRAPSLNGNRERRGRKSMDAAERLEVSDRMKKYWAMRRKARKAEAAKA